MVRNLIIVFISVVLLGGVVWADQLQTSEVRDAHLAKAIRYDENWAVRNGELHKFDASRHAWTSSKAAKALQIDTILHFTAEDGAPTWNDLVQGTAWDTVDNTLALADTMWHKDTFKAIAGTYSMWWGDPEIQGYNNETYQALIGPKMFISGDEDSLFLVHKQLIRCEQSHGATFEGWDGFNVRIKVTGADTMYEEIAPYKVAADSSYYQQPNIGLLARHEWNILRCWERAGESACEYDQGEQSCYTAPYDQWIGGFAYDSTTAPFPYIQTKIFDLRPFAGDTIQVCYVAGSDWAASTVDGQGDSTWFGFIIDDILIVEGLDPLTLAVLDTSTGSWPAALGGDTLFFDDFEGEDQGWTLYTPNVPTGNWWWLASGGHTGIYKAYCSDPFSGEYPENCENALESPKIAKSDLSGDLASLELLWYLKWQGTSDQADQCGAYSQYKLDDGEWTHISALNGTPYYMGLDGLTNDQWTNNQNWAGDTTGHMYSLTKLITDPTIVWDTLQVRVGFFSDVGADTSSTYGLQVDDLTLYGRIGAPYDLGVSAMKIPGPNANDREVVIDSVALTNYGFNVAASGVYQVFMAVLDTNRMAVFGPTQVLDFLNAPDVEPLETVMAPLDPTVAKFTMTEEMSYDVKVYTYWPSDTSGYNDTLKTEYTAKADYYPGFFNYPAGQGQLRYHDQGFYYYPYINIRSMSKGDIAAVHFTPDESLYPFDMRLALPQMADSNYTYTFHVWGSGNTPDEAPLLYSVSANSDSDRIVLSDVGELQHLSSDFWMGCEFPNPVGAIMGLESSENAGVVGRNWGHSYLDTDTSTWELRDTDWLITAVISWRTIDPEALPSLSGPPSKNSSGNLYLDWADVSQAKDYLVYRSTHVESTFPLLDSTTVSNYTDVGVVGNTSTHYYYLFHTRHVDGGIFDKTSKAIGEFDTSLLNAK